MNLTDMLNKHEDFPRTIKMLKFYNVLVDFLRIWGNNNIGNVEINLEKVTEYLLSGRWMVDGYDLRTEDDMYKFVEDEILNGMPIWEFFTVSDWTRGILEKSFKQEVEQIQIEMEQKYDCMTCKYYKVRESDFGISQECKRPRERFDLFRSFFELMEKGKCEFYERKGE